MTISRQKAWDTQKANLVDLNVEPGILDVCTAFNLLGMPTWESCEGHYLKTELRGSMYATPWVVISADRLPKFERDGVEHYKLLECANIVAQMLVDRKSKQKIEWRMVGTEPGGLSSANRRRFDLCRADVFAAADRKGWHERRCNEILRANQYIRDQLQILADAVPTKDRGQLELSVRLAGDQWQSFVACEVKMANGNLLKPGLQYPTRERKALCLEGQWLFKRFGEELRRFIFEANPDIITPVRIKEDAH